MTKEDDFRDDDINGFAFVLLQPLGTIMKYLFSNFS